MKISEIKYLYKKYHVPRHIIDHMAAVSAFAVRLGVKMKKKGIKIDLDLVKKAALTHDILRVCEFKKYDPQYFSEKLKKSDILAWKKIREKYGKIGHIRAMVKVLTELDENKLAKLVRLHDFFAVDKLKTWEEKLLYYSDKRIDHDKIVTLKKRFREGKKRNGKEGENIKKIMEIEKKIYKLEKEILKST